jgi:DNA (cytosine-5)-methyltransferase 1
MERGKCDMLNKGYYSVASLFCGAGGLDMGFDNQGFTTVWANDIEKDACATHRLWSKATVVSEDIKNIVFDDVPATDVILGGFPCQGFSLAGPRKIDDKRNSLYRFFANLVGEKKPYAFVAENVKGILTLGEGLILEAIIADFEETGYHVVPYSVNASDYGVPQDRERVIFVGMRNDLSYTFDLPKKFNKKVTIKEALERIPQPKDEDICSAPFSSRYMSRNRRRGWDDVSFTIPAMAKQVGLHPSSPLMTKIDKDLWHFGEGKTRRFSWQEAAAIQTFPLGMEFVGDLTSKYKQIGNAVPVKLAEMVASVLREALNKSLFQLDSSKIIVKAGA